MEPGSDLGRSEHATVVFCHVVSLLLSKNKRPLYVVIQQACRSSQRVLPAEKNENCQVAYLGSTVELQDDLWCSEHATTMCYHVVSSVLSEYEKNSPSGGLGPAPSIQCRKITLGGYTHTMVQASLTVQTAADGRSYHLAHHTRRWIRPITRPSARGPRPN